MADAEKVIGEVMTFEDLFTPNAMHEICKAAVPLATATAYLQPIYLAKATSNSATFGPEVKNGDLSVSITASISSSVIFCFPYGIIFKFISAENQRQCGFLFLRESAQLLTIRR